MDAYIHIRLKEDRKMTKRASYLNKLKVRIGFSTFIQVFLSFLISSYFIVRLSAIITNKIS